MQLDSKTTLSDKEKKLGTFPVNGKPYFFNEILQQ